jgi:hypothetical protein
VCGYHLINLIAEFYFDVIFVRVRAAGGGYTGVGTRVAVGGYNGYEYTRFFPKKKLTGPSQTHTRVPVYPPILGHGYEYCGYRVRVHGYGLYPAGFSKPLTKKNINPSRLSDADDQMRKLYMSILLLLQEKKNQRPMVLQI